MSDERVRAAAEALLAYCYPKTGNQPGTPDFDPMKPTRRWNADVSNANKEFVEHVMCVRDALYPCS